MSSLPANTNTPAARSISIGGIVSPPAPWVTSATPASAIVSAASAAFRSVMPPRQKPWLIVTLPPKPSARVRAQISWTSKRPISPRLVQMDVEPDPVPCGDREDAVELTFRIAVDLQGVDAADQIGALAHRRVEQVEDTGAAHDAALRKGDDLHAHK